MFNNIGASLYPSTSGAFWIVDHVTGVEVFDNMSAALEFLESLIAADLAAQLAGWAH